MYSLQMVDLNDDDRSVLILMEKERRANPYLIREKTELSKGDVNTILNRLGRAGFVRQVTRGLYEITETGKSKINEMDNE